jgi:hypothetical protein
LKHELTGKRALNAALGKDTDSQRHKILVITVLQIFHLPKVLKNIAKGGKGGIGLRYCLRI